MTSRLALTAIAVTALAAPAVPAAAAPATTPATTPATVTATVSAASSLAFGACPADIAGSYPELTCATLKVPLDYAHPVGRSVSLLITKRAANNPAKRLGSLLVNPGGPGGGGASYAGSLTKADANGVRRLDPAVLDSYDVIGFDPRGVSHSAPISCVDPAYFAPPQPDPDNPANRATLWKSWSGYADGCAAKSGSVLPFLGTTNVARDMDTIRAALGDPKLNYLGFSYGTYLGAVYGQLFPQKVGRMILDGNIDPTPQDMWYQAGLTQSAALQKRLESYFGWVAQYDSVYHLGSTVAQVRAAWNKTLTDFRTTPHGVVGGSELLGTAYAVMFSETYWIPFAEAISAYAVAGDDTELVDFSTPDTSAGTEHANAIFNAVICVDSTWSRDRATYERDAARVAQVSQFAWYNIWTSGSPCQNWPISSPGRVKITGAGLPGVLMFNTIGDPATPYEGALKMHQSLPTSVLVTEKDSGKHCVFANPQAAANPAANAIGTKYLLTGELPAGDTTVPGHALPVPTKTVKVAALPLAQTRAAE
ncbi:alpha/beta fold hydrolase [Kribbella sp. NPDC051952]|uniref:alpha/beta fold hydrolase n=1 Tax=Kribbella sp. NPDC051952 TaxID=3154851 RepID=UPI00343AD4C1